MNCPLCGADNPGTRVSCVVCRGALGPLQAAAAARPDSWLGDFLTERVRATVKFLLTALLGGMVALLYFRFLAPEESQAPSGIALMAVLCGGMAAALIAGIVIPSGIQWAREFFWKIKISALSKNISSRLDAVIHECETGETTADAQARLGAAYLLKEQRDRAFAACEKGVAEFPEDAVLCHNRGVVLAGQGQLPRALEDFRKAQGLGTDEKISEVNIALAMISASAPGEAVAECRRAWELARGRTDVLNLFAVCLAEAGYSEEALARLQGGLSEEPNNPELLINLGALRFRQGDLDGAFQGFSSACAYETAPGLAHHNTALCCLLRGQLAEARSYFSAVLHEDAGFAASLGQCAIMHLMTNHHKRALEELRDAVHHAQNDFELRHNHSVLLLQEHRLEEALAEEQRAGELRPKDHDAAINLSAINYHLRRYRSVIEVAARAVELYPESAPARYNLALALDAMERYDEAEEHLAWLTERYPRFAAAWNNLGAIRLIKGETVNAANDFIHASEVFPDDPNIALNLALAHYLEGDEAACSQQLEIVRAHEPDSAALLDVLGHLEADKKHPRGAIAAWYKLLDKESTNIEVLTNLGISYYRDEQTDAAVGCLRKVLLLQPRAIFAHNNLALGYAKNKLLTEALHHISKVVELQPDNPIVHSNVGLIQFFKGNTEQAMHHWREVTRLSPAYARKREATRLSTYDDSEMVLFKIDCRRRVRRMPPQMAAFRHEARFSVKRPRFIPVLPWPELVEIQGLKEELEAMRRRAQLL